MFGARFFGNTVTEYCSGGTACGKITLSEAQKGTCRKKRVKIMQNAEFHRCFLLTGPSKPCKM